jgi:hypothetical protein
VYLGLSFAFTKPSHHSRRAESVAPALGPQYNKRSAHILAVRNGTVRHIELRKRDEVPLDVLAREVLDIAGERDRLGDDWISYETGWPISRPCSRCSRPSFAASALFGSLQSFSRPVAALTVTQSGDRFRLVLGNLIDQRVLGPWYPERYPKPLTTIK